MLMVVRHIESSGIYVMHIEISCCLSSVEVLVLTVYDVFIEFRVFMVVRHIESSGIYVIDIQTSCCLGSV